MSAYATGTGPAGPRNGWEWAQLAVLLAQSLLLLWLAPTSWHFTPDSGIYVGTAETLLREGRYYFNGHPNLLYYPGFSGLLAMVGLFSPSIAAWHLFSAAMVVATLWLARACFHPSRYGLAGLVVPILMPCAGILLSQSFRILSDASFLAVSLGALLAWRGYRARPGLATLSLCAALVALATLIRFQGVFLLPALALGLLLHDPGGRHPIVRRIGLAVVVPALAFAPFALWTWRNVALHTSDTFNMFNHILLGLESLSIYTSAQTPDVPWIDAAWKYPAYRSLLFVHALARQILGSAALAPFPKEIVVALVLLLIAAGLRPWLRRACTMEIAYVALSVFYLAYSHVWAGGRSLHIVPRYWLPMLPFVLVVMCLGIGSLQRALSRVRLGLLGHAATVVLLGSAFVNAGQRLAGHAGESEYFQRADTAIREAASYVNNRAPPGVTVATTDWGVMPRYLGRASYALTEYEALALKRMVRYRTRYLVVVDGLGRAPPIVRAMIEKHPGPFRRAFEVAIGPPDHVVSVYEVDLDALKALVSGHGRGVVEPTRAGA